MICFHINPETLRFRIICRFYFYRDQLTIPLYHKVNFRTTRRLPVIHAVSVCHKLYVDIILSHTALEVIQFLYHIENIIRHKRVKHAKKGNPRGYGIPSLLSVKPIHLRPKIYIGKTIAHSVKSLKQSRNSHCPRMNYNMVPHTILPRQSQPPVT